MPPVDITMMNPYWLEDEPVPRAAPMHDGTVDVAIVGAGITGMAAA
jgi:monoamine oxidase